MNPSLDISPTLSGINENNKFEFEKHLKSLNPQVFDSQQNNYFNFDLSRGSSKILFLIFIINLI